ncbi:hypothetical protein ABZS29_26050 [Kribbella sp. NPDC005582]|uniref:hypothetical protein n=1 Tax=Kribbella sp. NPDC005582 TaxID=3156893 RepID=UPI0033AF5E06
MSNPTTPGDSTPQESPESGAPKPAPDAAAAVEKKPAASESAAAEKAEATEKPTTAGDADKSAKAEGAAAPEKPAAASKTADSGKRAAAGEAADAAKPPAAGKAADAAKPAAAGKTADGAKPAGADGAAAAAGATSTADAAGGVPGASKAEAATAADKPADAAGGVPGASGGDSKDAEKKVGFWRRGPFVTVAGAVVVLLVLAVLGYVWGLGPLNRLNTARGITPPAKLAGLDRVTDADIRNQLQLDQTRQALSRINNGKQATVEAYGNLDGDRLFVVIALRGKVDIAKTVADSGASPDKVKKIGQATCVETTGNLPTQCYRGSNTLTVIAQSANEGITVDQVAPVAVEAFHAMK